MRELTSLRLADLCTLARIVLAGPDTFHQLVDAAAARTGSSSEDILSLLMTSWIDRVRPSQPSTSRLTDLSGPRSLTTCLKEANASSSPLHSLISSPPHARLSSSDCRIWSRSGRARWLRRRRPNRESELSPPHLCTRRNADKIQATAPSCTVCLTTTRVMER